MLPSGDASTSPGSCKPAPTHVFAGSHPAADLSKRTTAWVASPFVDTWTLPAAPTAIPSADFGVDRFSGAPPAFGNRRTCAPTCVVPHTSPVGPTATSMTFSPGANAYFVLYAPFAEKTWMRRLPLSAT